MQIENLWTLATPTTRRSTSFMRLSLSAVVLVSLAACGGGGDGVQDSSTKHEAILIDTVGIAAPQAENTAPKISALSRAGTATVTLPNATDFVAQQYRDLLGREADAAGLNSWVSQLNAGTVRRMQIVQSLLDSNESKGRYGPAVRLYAAYFLRQPDYAGLMYWLGKMYPTSGTSSSLAQVSQAFAQSTEFVNRYGSLSNEGFVNLVYQNVLGRQPEALGHDYWIGQLNFGLSRGELMIGFSESTENKKNTTNSTFVTTAYTAMLHQMPSATENIRWVSDLNSGLQTTLGLIDALLQSEQYAQRFGLNLVNTPGIYDDPYRLYSYETLNRVRGITGVGYLKQSQILDKAGQAHADYFSSNQNEIVDSISMHSEKANLPGFIGAMPTDRARHFGYTANVFEALNGNAGNGHIFGLLGVPYHAIILLSNQIDVGIGWWSIGILTVETGTPSGSRTQRLPSDFVAIYPCNNIQVNVQAQGYEIPTPAVLNGKQNFGYSSVALVREKIEVTSWELRDASGVIVPTTVMTQANDTKKYFGPHLASLIPIDTLPRIETSYTSVLKGKNNGMPFEKTCTWRTVAGSTIPT